MGVLDVVSPELSDFRKAYPVVHKFETLTIDYFIQEKPRTL